MTKHFKLFNSKAKYEDYRNYLNDNYNGVVETSKSYFLNNYIYDYFLYWGYGCIASLFNEGVVKNA